MTTPADRREKLLATRDSAYEIASDLLVGLQCGRYCGAHAVAARRLKSSLYDLVDDFDLLLEIERPRP